MGRIIVAFVRKKSSVLQRELFSLGAVIAVCVTSYAAEGRESSLAWMRIRMSGVRYAGVCVDGGMARDGYDHGVVKANGCGGPHLRRANVSTVATPMFRRLRQPHRI
jgi:hypothetical protein